MKMWIAILIASAGSLSSFASNAQYNINEAELSSEDIEICGKYVISEDLYEGKPANEFLGVTATAWSWSKYYLKPRGGSQKELLQNMIEGKNYCIEGRAFWCGEDDAYKCIALKNVRSR